MSNETHNGYTNYATWRVHVEILGNMEFKTKVTANDLSNIIEDIVFSFQIQGGYMEDYARAFIRQVNFYEIAELINKDLE